MLLTFLICMINFFLGVALREWIVFLMFIIYHYYHNLSLSLSLSLSLALAGMINVRNEKRQSEIGRLDGGEGKNNISHSMRKV